MPQITVGASLLAMAVCQAQVMLAMPALSLAGQLPQFDWGVCGMCVYWRSRVGAGLLAKAVCQAQVMLTVPALSLAGQLPQLIGVYGEFASAGDPVWERACSRRRWVRHR